MTHTRHRTRPDSDDTADGSSGQLPPALAGLVERIPDWPWVAGFAGVTILVALLGFLISDGVEPLVRPPTAPRAPVVASSPPTTAATAVSETASTIPADEETETAPPASGPAVIELSGGTLDFGETGIAGEFQLTNTGDSAADWTALSSSEAIAFSARGGSLPPGETVTLRVSLDRSLVAEGEVSETITIRWIDGEAQVTATAVQEDNPIIHNPRANPVTVSATGEGCSGTQTTVSARIRDTSTIASAVVRWSPDGSASNETAMNELGGDMFEAVIGPFTSTQTASVRVVAFDELGNAGGATIALTVEACS